MGQLRVLRADDFTGGLNLRADPFQLAPNESPDLLNVDVDPRGGFSMRGGWERWNTTAVGAIANGSFVPYTLYNWTRSTPQLLVSANNKVFFSSSGSFTDTTISVSGAACFAAWSGAASVVYVACGAATAQMAKWNGSSATLLTASATGQWQDSYASPTGTHMPRANLAASHADRLWVANTLENGTSFPNRVRFSHFGAPESWRQVDYIDIVAGGDGITALVPFRDSLLVFKANSVHAIYGFDTDSFQVVTLTEATGTVSQQTVTATEMGVFFFDWPDGLVVYDGQGFKDLFEKIRPLIQSGGLNEAATGKVWVSHANSKVWLSLPTGSATTPNMTYVFDPTISAWSRYQGADGSGLAAAVDFVTSTGTRLYLATHPTQPFVLQVDRLTAVQDNITGTAANFASYFTTPWVDAGMVSAKKMWRRPDLVVKRPAATFNLTVQVFHDWQESVVKRTSLLTVDGPTGSLMWAATAVEPDANPGWGQASWGAVPTGAAFEKGASLGLARSVQLKISGPGGRAWGVNSISYKYNMRKVR